MIVARALLFVGPTLGLWCLLGAGPALGQQTPILSQSEKILAVDGSTGDRFGVSVGLTSGVAVVGAYWDDAPGVDSGSAHVYDRQVDDSWLQTARLTASDGAPFDRFGAAVGVSGERVAVGSFWDDDLGEKSGSAYVFERQGDGSWREVAKLTAADGAPGDFFGWSVDIDGERVLVGAYNGDTAGATDSGVAYIYERQGDGSWLETAKLTPSDAEPGQWFGLSAALDGDTAVLGSIHDTDLGFNSGSAYVYERQEDGTWLEAAKLLASDGEFFDLFGNAVSVSDDVAVVAAVWDETDDLGAGAQRRVEMGRDQASVSRGTGSAYIFQRQPDGSWPQVQKLLASDKNLFDEFGRSLSLDAGTLAVGAYNNDDVGAFSGTVYVFERQADDTWLEVLKLLPGDLAGGDFFGWYVGAAEGLVLSSSVLDDDAGGTSGSAYIFDLSFRLTLAGVCPGETTVTMTGGEPNSMLALFGGDSWGRTPMPTGPCAGTDLHLGNPVPVGRIEADESGGATHLLDVPRSVCGLYLQAVDLATCAVSSVPRIP